MDDHKTLFMLIGPKGSGKTHIGGLVNQNTDITFLRVESIWLTVQPGENGWQKVENAIDVEFKTHDKLMVESLGAGEGFQKFFDSLSRKYPIKMIHVLAGLDTCLQRVKERDSKDHIAVSDDKVMAYNKVAVGVVYPWAAEINNDPPAATEEILNVIRTLEN